MTSFANLPVDSGALTLKVYIDGNVPQNRGQIEIKIAAMQNCTIRSLHSNNEYTPHSTKNTFATIEVQLASTSYIMFRRMACPKVMLLILAPAAISSA